MIPILIMTVGWNSHSQHPLPLEENFPFSFHFLFFLFNISFSYILTYFAVCVVVSALESGEWYGKGKKEKNRGFRAGRDHTKRKPY